MSRNRAKELRKKSTQAEKDAKKILLKYHVKFKTQFIISHGKYYVDFLLIPSPCKPCKKKVALEIDGGYHDIPEQKAKDKIRDAYLKKLGYRVVRFKNEDVKKPKFKKFVMKYRRDYIFF